MTPKPQPMAIRLGLIFGTVLVAACEQGNEPTQHSARSVSSNLDSTADHGTTPEVMTMTGGWALSGRPDSYDYAPSYMIDQWDSFKHKVWWCGLGDDGFDAVLYAERAGYQDPWTIVGPVFSHGQAGAPPWEGAHTCDPSVVRGHWVIGGRAYGYALYFTANDPVDNSVSLRNNRVGVAFSNDGRSWERYPEPVVMSHFPGNTGYGAGQQTVFSADAGAAIHMIHSDVNPAGEAHYYYRYSPDGLSFTGPEPISLRGWASIAWNNTAVAAAAGGGYVYLSKVDTMYEDGASKAIAVYRIPAGELLTGTWQKVAVSGGVRATEAEPGFLTDAYGSLSATLPTVTTLFACTDRIGNSLGNTYSWDLCHGSFTLR